ncbi:MAG: hypothetical protein LBQ97_01140 [Fusobacteriaceae bacterium]|nr:hypothetical protein [Fusobacteriaceae bacterium]
MEEAAIWGIMDKEYADGEKYIFVDCHPFEICAETTRKIAAEILPITYDLENKYAERWQKAMRKCNPEIPLSCRIALSDAGAFFEETVVEVIKEAAHRMYAPKRLFGDLVGRITGIDFVTPVWRGVAGLALSTAEGFRDILGTLPGISNLHALFEAWVLREMCEQGEEAPTVEEALGAMREICLALRDLGAIDQVTLDSFMEMTNLDALFKGKLKEKIKKNRTMDLGKKYAERWKSKIPCVLDPENSKTFRLVLLRAEQILQLALKDLRIDDERLRQAEKSALISNLTELAEARDLQARLMGKEVAADYAEVKTAVGEYETALLALNAL